MVSRLPHPSFKVIQDDSAWYLEVDQTIPADSGCYICVAENAAGKVFCTARLAVDDDLPAESVVYKKTNLEDDYYILEELGRQSGPNLEKLHDAYETQRQLILVLELVNQGNVLDQVLSDQQWTEAKAAQPSNVRFSSNDLSSLRLTDFGFSRKLPLSRDLEFNFGTPEFCSPEAVSNEAVTPASDIWAVGVLTHLLARLSAAACLDHPWLKDAGKAGTKKLDTSKLKAFQHRFHTLPLRHAEKARITQQEFSSSVVVTTAVLHLHVLGWESLGAGLGVKREAWRVKGEQRREEGGMEGKGAPGPYFKEKLHNLAFGVDDTVILRCVVAGPPTPTCVWYKNEELLSEGNRLKQTLYNLPGRNWMFVEDRGEGKDRWSSGLYTTLEAAIVSGLTPNTKYRFRVSATNRFGTGHYSWSSVEVCTAHEGSEHIERDNLFDVSKLRSGQCETQPSLPTEHDDIIPEEELAQGRPEISLQEVIPDTVYNVGAVLYKGKFYEDKAVTLPSQNDKAFVMHSVFSPAAGLHEFETLRSLHHERLACLCAAYRGVDQAKSDASVVHLVLEHLQGDHIARHLSQRRKYSEDTVASIIRQSSSIFVKSVNLNAPRLKRCSFNPPFPFPSTFKAWGGKAGRYFPCMPGSIVVIKEVSAHYQASEQ
ncbi:myosin light chain kinase, smooth muscle-like, partial [Elysia marginata]